MSRIKTFEYFNQLTLYTKDWEVYLPNNITIIKDSKRRSFHKENVMLHADMVQISYVADKNEFGHPDEMGIDIYTIIKNNYIKLDIDIIYGDITVSEFGISAPDKVSIIFDPTNINFSFDDKTINSIVEFFNKFDGIKISPENINFLRN